MKREEAARLLTRREMLSAATRSAAAVGVGSLAPTLSSCSFPARKTWPPVVDTHIHVWGNDPEKYPYPHPHEENFTYGDTHDATVEMLIDDMDRHGVTHCVLVQVVFHGWDNSYIAHSVRKYPDRLVAHGLFDPLDPKVADKLEYGVKEHGLVGMRLRIIEYLNGYRGGDGWLDSKEHDALWKKAAELDAVFNLFIDATQLPRLSRMIDRHPDVKVCIDHFGAALHARRTEEDLQSLLAVARHKNVWVKCAELAGSGVEYPFHESYPKLKRVYETFGPDRLLWGTGYPGACRAAYKRPTLAQELALIRTEIPFFNDEDRAKILGLNAARIWKLV